MTALHSSAVLVALSLLVDAGASPADAPPAPDVPRIDIGIYIHHAERDNVVWYDDVVVSTGYIGPGPVGGADGSNDTRRPGNPLRRSVRFAWVSVWARSAFSRHRGAEKTEITERIRFRSKEGDRVPLVKSSVSSEASVPQYLERAHAACNVARLTESPKKPPGRSPGGF